MADNVVPDLIEVDVPDIDGPPSTSARTAVETQPGPREYTIRILSNSRSP